MCVQSSTVKYSTVEYRTVLVQCSLIELIELCMTLTQTGNITQSENFYSTQNDAVAVRMILNVMENMFVLRDTDFVSTAQ